MVEATADGVAPAFQGEGFVRPARVPLIEAGRLTGSLVSPRTEREFGLKANGANGWETPESLAMAGGTLAAKDALAALGTGLFVGNLHYLNYSDRPACRLTGMTRFATFWVEGGEIVAPVDVLRFDDTVFRMLGPNLEALTAETELMLASDTYGARQLSSMRVPGALALGDDVHPVEPFQMGGVPRYPAGLRSPPLTPDFAFGASNQSACPAAARPPCHPFGIEARSRCVYASRGWR